MELTPSVHIACEGDDDGAVAGAILRHVGYEVGEIYVRRGKGNLDSKLRAYNNAARFEPWLILRDLDFDAPCPSELSVKLVPLPSKFLCFRLPVRTVEAWLLADTKAVASFLGVRIKDIADAPDLLNDPKLELVNLARRSKKPAIRSDIVPAPGVRRKVGPAYTARMIEFVYSEWDPAKASERSPSLKRCLNRLAALPRPPGF